MVRSPVSIFFLAFIPGMGHFAINRIGRAVTFMLLFFGILGGGGLLAVASGDGGNILIVIFFRSYSMAVQHAGHYHLFGQAPCWRMEGWLLRGKRTIRKLPDTSNIPKWIFT